MAEPSTERGPVRFFIGGQRPDYETLGELREGMSVIDSEIVRLLAKRADFVYQATLFKTDLDESKAPAQQASNIVKARERAEAIGSRLPGFVDIVGVVYEAMVPAYVAAQHEVFSQTVLNTDGHPMEPEIWDLGYDTQYKQRIIEYWHRKSFRK